MRKETGRFNTRISPGISKKQTKPDVGEIQILCDEKALCFLSCPPYICVSLTAHAFNPYIIDVMTDCI